MSDLFGHSGRELLTPRLELLPPHTLFATDRILEQLDGVEEQIEQFEQRMREVFKKTPTLELLMTLPGVGFILSIVILVEVGDIHRFPDAEHQAGYAGTTPRIDATGGKIRYGRLRPDVNRYLKWAYIEVANAIRLHQRHWTTRHVVRLYQRIARRKGHRKSIGAVARHFAEATYWILTKEVPYQEPKRHSGASTKT